LLKAKKISYLFAVLFCLTILTGIGGASAMAATQPTDITGNWAQSQIQKAVDQGIVVGYPDGTFKPEQFITRAEFVTTVNNAFGFTAEASNNFTDVKSTDWFAVQIARAKAAGYVSGYEDGTFRPNNYITREEVAVILAQVIKPSNPVTLDSLNKYKDAALISSWAQQGVASATGSGIFDGYPDQTFRPQNFITRAESVVALLAAMQIKTTPITPVAQESITVTAAGNVTTVQTGQTLQMIATVLPANATNKSVTWSETNGTGLAGINATTGLLTASGVGTVTVEATANDASGVSGTEQITVTAVSGGGGGGGGVLTTITASAIVITANSPAVNTTVVNNAASFDGTSNSGAITGIQFTTNVTSPDLVVSSIFARGQNWLQSPVTKTLSAGGLVTTTDLLGNLDSGTPGISLGSLRRVWGTSVAITGKLTKSGYSDSSTITININLGTDGNAPYTIIDNQYATAVKTGSNIAVTIKSGQGLTTLADAGIMTGLTDAGVWPYYVRLGSSGGINTGEVNIKAAIAAVAGKPWTDVTLTDLKNITNDSVHGPIEMQIINGGTLYTVTVN
jgi:hypothetical protein